MRIKIDRTKVKVLKHHRAVDVFTDGRYLHVSMKISTQSKNGRQLARETAAEILNAVGASDEARKVFDIAQARDSDAEPPGQTGLDP
jgi:tellurite resistance protein